MAVPQYKDDGVCAKVRIRIEQRLAITRDAFRATLELDNGEAERLTGIGVTIDILDRKTQERAQHKFAIGTNLFQTGPKKTDTVVLPLF